MAKKLFAHLFRLSLLLSILALLAGCGSGASDESDDGSPDESTPTVRSTVPSNGAADIPVDSALLVTFSDDIDPASITASTFVVKAGSEPVSGTVSCTAKTATFTPSSPLAKGTTYTAELTTGVKSTGGKALGAGYTWSFSTVPGDADYAYVLTEMKTEGVLDGTTRAVRRFSYHPDRNMVEEASNAGESETAHTCLRYFDAAGDLIRKEETIDEVPEPLVQLFYYNDKHYCVNIVETNDNTLRTFTYEEGGSYSRVTESITDVVSEYFYYPDENKLVMNDTEVLYFTYDASGREIRNDLDFDNNGTIDYTTMHTYDGNGNLEKIDYYEGEGEGKLLVVTVHCTWERKDISGMTINFAYLQPYATNRNEPTLLWQLVNRGSSRSWETF